ncbi:hypothetical protein U1Q18_039419 [Sarracenia purpurea var. burkii]
MRGTALGFLVSSDPPIFMSVSEFSMSEKRASLLISVLERDLIDFRARVKNYWSSGSVSLNWLLCLVEPADLIAESGLTNC